MGRLLVWGIFVRSVVRKAQTGGNRAPPLLASSVNIELGGPGDPPTVLLMVRSTKYITDPLKHGKLPPTPAPLGRAHHIGSDTRIARSHSGAAGLAEE